MIDINLESHSLWMRPLEPLTELINSNGQGRKESWRLLDLEFESPYMNMAVEEAVARKVGEGSVPNTIRFWRNFNAVVIGSYQDVETEVNLDRCAKYGTSIVRRFTGGGAVYHDTRNLNFAIALPQSHRLVKDDLLETFRLFSKGVIMGMEYLGIKDANWESANSIVVNKLKISGLAGCVKWGAFFCHGSILVCSNLSRLIDVLHSTMSGDARYIQSVKKPITTVSDQIGRKASIQIVKMALRKGFEEVFDIVLVHGELAPEERSVASKLYRDKYSTRRWNFERLWE